MASFDIAITHVLKNEGGLNLDSRDLGCSTKFGISLRFLKSLGLDYDLNKDGVIDEEDIFLLDIATAKSIYKKYFWDKLKLDSVEGQSLATKIFDFSINMGESQAVKLLQKSINYAKQKEVIKVDGVIGPGTLNAIKSIDHKKLELYLTGIACNFYVQLCNNDSHHLWSLESWLRRATANYNGG